MTDRFLKNGYAVFALLLAVNFIAHYLYIRNFGLYEVDYRYIPPMLDKDLSHVLVLARECFVKIITGKLGFEGRPFGVFFMHSLSIVGFKAAGLSGLYIIAWLFCAVSSYLTYKIFAARNEEGFGLVAGLFVALFPAYALRQFLTSELWVMPSLIFMLLAIKGYLGGRRILPYLFIIVSLLTYESLVFPFLATPFLLKVDWDWKFLKRLLIHSCVVIIIVGIVVVLRGMEGENRIAAAGGYLHEIPMRVAIFVLYGTFASLFYSYWFAIVKVATNLDAPIIATIVLMTTALTGLLYFIGRRVKGFSPDMRQQFKYLAASIVFIMLSYVTGFFSGFYEYLATENTLVDIFSRIHLPAAFGSAVFFASVYTILTERLRRIGIAFAAVFSLLLAILAGYGQFVQYDYKKAWEYQQCLWTSVAKKAPDFKLGDILLLENVGLPPVDAKYVSNVYAWDSLPLALPLIYDISKEEKKPEIILKYYPYWQRDALRKADGHVEINHTPPASHTSSAARWEAVEQGKVIYLKAFRREIERVDGIVNLNGFDIKLKPLDASAAGLPKGLLHDYFIKDACSFNELTKSAEPREIESAPRLSQTIFFNDKKHLQTKLAAQKGIKQFTIELWLRPGENAFSPENSFDKVYPPMPGIIGPLRLDHREVDVLGVSIMTADKKGVALDVRDMLVGKTGVNWLHLELDVDNDKGEALFFLNGRLEKKFFGVNVPLSGDVLLGKGYFERFWKGEIADVRISTVVRHVEDFKPESALISRDEHTIYPMDGQ